MRRTSLGAVVLASFAGSPCAMAVVPGHVQDFPEAGNLHGYQGGSQVYENPGTGGVGGAGDGYLIVRNINTNRLGTVSVSPEYFGDWITAGATGVSFYLQNGATTEALQIHFGIGNQQNFWQLNTAFVPTAEWTQHFVDFTNPAIWTRTHGSGTFENALRNTDRIHWRHDLPPYTSAPNAVIGDFALDRVVVIPAPGPCALALAGLLVGARRRH